ncbi:MAG: gas vesicle protein K, partial [Microcystis sp.]
MDKLPTRDSPSKTAHLPIPTMTLACTPYDSDNQALLTRPESNSQAGLAP